MWQSTRRICCCIQWGLDVTTAFVTKKLKTTLSCHCSEVSLQSQCSAQFPHCYIKNVTISSVTATRKSCMTVASELTVSHWSFFSAGILCFIPVLHMHSRLIALHSMTSVTVWLFFSFLFSSLLFFSFLFFSFLFFSFLFFSFLVRHSTA